MLLAAHQNVLLVLVAIMINVIAIIGVVKNAGERRTETAV